ncbi:putative YL1 nuclear protein [Trypanosoma vivax]|nr:putative YL1 nuclear protein [Trypanosoma vivax]
MDDDSRWDVTEGRRPRRSNRGSMMQELLEKGLNSDEERLLNNLSDVTSDSTFTASQEAVDEVDSDFSDEEIEGVLDGADVETDATLMREEKRERKMERQRTAVRREASFRGERANGLALAPRLRPPPTIPLAVRLAEARKRALEARTGPLVGYADSNAGKLCIVAKRRRLSSGRSLGIDAGVDGERREEMIGGGEPEQRIRYVSNMAVLRQYGVPVVISFSKCLPPIFHSG